MKITNKYGLFQYKTDNIGDEIQSLAAKRFLPKVDYYFDRDEIDKTKIAKGDKVKLIVNGWYTHKPENWPPKNLQIEPLLISMHINPYSEATLEAFKKKASARFLNTHCPVGARDLTTLKFLQKNGVESYFSGCMTLTLTKDKKIKRRDYILAVDVSDKIYEGLKKRTTARIVRIGVMRTTELSAEAKEAIAKYYLLLYQSAKAVITTRLHCLLPCLALETPVLAILKQEPKRYAGLIELAHHTTEKEFLKDKVIYNFEEPPQNPTEYKKLRKGLEKRCTEFTGYDAKQSYLGGQTANDFLESEALGAAIGELVQRSYERDEFKRTIPELDAYKQSVINEKEVEIEKLNREIRELKERIVELENPGVKMAAKSLLGASKRYLEKQGK